MTTENEPLHGGGAVESRALQLPSHTIHCITATAGCEQEAQSLLCDAAETAGASIVHQMFFAGYNSCEYSRCAAPAADWPVTRMRGTAGDGGGFFSTQAIAVTGIIPHPIKEGGRAVGCWFEDDVARYCWLGDILPPGDSAGRFEQAYGVFDSVSGALKQCDMCFNDVVRTWLYLDDILQWYEDFNRARTTFFEEYGMFDAILPASTGIGCGNTAGAALAASAVAVKSKNGAVGIKQIESPLQPPAVEYKSSFARAVEVFDHKHRYLYVSGTASIDERGNSICQNDPAGQVGKTMQVAGALLESRDMNWNNVFRGIAYCKNKKSMEVFEHFRHKTSLPRFPLAVSIADICREELTFEIEIDAVALNK